MKLIRFLFFPFAIIYDVVTTIRNYFYDVHIFKSVRFKIPVIAVGNLSVGGTGKSPQIEYLIRLLQNDKKVAVLSRGYKRKTSGFILINETHSAEDVGDEPLQFYKKYENISVAVDADRANGIRQLQKLVQPEVVLLDDAFQHRKVTAGFYILLTKFNDLYTNDFLLPTGNLRESRRGAKRADVIIVTKCPENLSENEQSNIRAKLKITSNQKLFFTSISYHKTTAGSHSITLDELEEYEILLVTGIANPTPFVDFLQKKKCKIHHLDFPDHYDFTEADIIKINQKFEGMNSSKKMILTTEKDYMRLFKKLKNLSYLEIETQFLNEEQELNKAIKQYCNINF